MSHHLEAAWDKFHSACSELVSMSEEDRKVFNMACQALHEAITYQNHVNTRFCPVCERRWYDDEDAEFKEMSCPWCGHWAVVTT